MSEKTVLTNGVKVITEKIPYLRSVSLGIWVNTGSRDETLRDNGISHFIEHMLFKGTRRRTAHEIAKEIDSVGGILNAFTGKEHSSLYVKVLNNHLPLATDLLSDLFLNSLFDPQEMERERNVILQEIKMVEDTPEDHIVDIFNRSFWKGSSLGYPVLGLRNTISKIGRRHLLDFFKGRYLSSEIIISAAGNLDSNRFVAGIAKHFEDLPQQTKKKKRTAPKPNSVFLMKQKKLEQAHLCIGLKGPSATDPCRYIYYTLNTILGGGISSRLFQAIRERYGLAYTVYSYLSSFSDTGMIGIYVATTSKELPIVLELIQRELISLKERPVDPKELHAAKEQLKGNLLLSLESSDSRMSRLARNEIYFGKAIPIEEIQEKVDEVKEEEVQEVASLCFVKDLLSITILGDIREKNLPGSLLDI